MELNFSSVETVPNLNASAAFQVDSGKVFKEDTDIVSIIIGCRLPPPCKAECKQACSALASFVGWRHAVSRRQRHALQHPQAHRRRWTFSSTKFAALVTASAVVCERQIIVIPSQRARCSFRDARINKSSDGRVDWIPPLREGKISDNGTIIACKWEKTITFALW